MGFLLDKPSSRFTKVDNSFICSSDDSFLGWNLSQFFDGSSSGFLQSCCALEEFSLVDNTSGLRVIIVRLWETTTVVIPSGNPSRVQTLLLGPLRAVDDGAVVGVEVERKSHEWENHRVADDLVLSADVRHNDVQEVGQGQDTKVVSWQVVVQEHLSAH
ncbi:hypothetical protein WICPIJ_008561 [Wickerhamomyces pijperi]|uniref:Uncharacterized protein n=1 Tax=Wickerhamomyces pijperi TaxID=599730 RepID=A0A9P8TI70_WICPI|nr:hypothetical protein WICPIJ_008561 [Wickerhamomyces pijperi]